MCEHDVESIAAEIMTYLNQRPTASDSVDGITHWWLVRQSIAQKIDMVEQALEQLAQEGKISKRTNASSEIIYCLSRLRS